MIALFLSLAMADDPATAGRAVYEARCLVCHGDEGRGDGPASMGLSVRPPDMRASAFWEGRTDEGLRQVIVQGTESGTMRGNRLSDERLTELLAYLNTLKP